MYRIESIPDSDLKKVRVWCSASPEADVSLTGSFNDWEAAHDKMSYSAAEQIFFCELLLPPGNYEYKLIINGDWVADEENPNFIANDFGTLNSVLIVE